MPSLSSTSTLSPQTVLHRSPPPSSRSPCSSIDPFVHHSASFLILQRLPWPRLFPLVCNLSAVQVEQPQAFDFEGPSSQRCAITPPQATVQYIVTRFPHIRYVYFAYCSMLLRLSCSLRLPHPPSSLPPTDSFALHFASSSCTSGATAPCRFLRESCQFATIELCSPSLAPCAVTALAPCITPTVINCTRRHCLLQPSLGCPEALQFYLTGFIASSIRY